MRRELVNPYEPPFVPKKKRNPSEPPKETHVVFGAVVVIAFVWCGFVVYEEYRMSREELRMRQETAELLDKTSELLRQRAKYESRVTGRPRRVDRFRRSFLNR